MLPFSQRLIPPSSTNLLTNQIENRKRLGLPSIDLTQTNPTRALADYPHSAIASAFGRLTDLTYRPDPCGTIKARQAVAGYYAARGIQVAPASLFLTASTSEAYTYLFKLLCNPGEAVLSPVPSYPLFEHLAALASVEIRPYRLLYDGAWHIDFEHLRAQICTRTRAIVVVNPNNPTGHFPGSDREKLLALAAEFKLPVISDEVFLDYPMDVQLRTGRTLIGAPETPVFAMNGLSKAAGMPQMKLAWTALSGSSAGYCAEAMARLELMGDTYLSVATPVQEALPELLQTGEGIRAGIAAQVRSNWEILKAALVGTSANVYHLEAGWSAIVRLPETMNEDNWAAQLLNEHGTIVQPGYYFDIEGGVHIVISLLTSPVDFRRGLDALKNLLASTRC